MTTKNPATGNAPGLPSALDERGEDHPIPADFAGRFNISNKAIRNDDLGAFGEFPQRMADALSSLQRDDLLAPLHPSDGENMPYGQLAIAICEAKGLPYIDEESAIKQMEAYEFSYIQVDIDTEKEG